LPVGDRLDRRAAPPPVLGKDGQAWRMRGAKPPAAEYRTVCSAGASLRRANAELVKLNAPVLLPSSPRLTRLKG